MNYVNRPWILYPDSSNVVSPPEVENSDSKLRLSMAWKWRGISK